MANRRARANAARFGGFPEGGAPSIHELGAAGDVGAAAPYVDAAYYTKTYRSRTEDVDFYRALALGVGGPVLEYGTGNGRIAIAIARAGVPVVGVDLSRHMLESFALRLGEQPKAVQERIELVRGDMRNARLRRRFPLVIAPFNAVLHLYDRGDVEAFFASVRRHLKPGGRFVFDYSIPTPQELCRDPARWYGSAPFRHPTTGQRLRYAERFEYDPIRQLLLVEMRFTPEDGSPGWIVPLTHRQFFPREMAALLAHSGFGRVIWTADFQAKPPDETSDTLVATCSLR